MRIIGCDYHPSWQQVCWLETATGETGEQKLEHASGEAERFYRQLLEPALIGMESTGNCQWFVELLAQLGHELLVGDAAKIRASDPRQQKHDRRDAALILKLLVEGRFPRIWIPSEEEKDLRQLLIHRYKLVRLRAGKERTATPGDESGRHEEAQAVEQGGREGAARASLAALEQPTARRPVQDKRDVGRPDCPARSSRGGSGGEE